MTSTDPREPPPPPPLLPPQRSSLANFFGAFLAATGVLLLVVFGGCTGFCVVIGEVSPRDRTAWELFQVGVAGTVIGGVLLAVGLYVRRKR